jgi:hypothetical protein
MIGEAENSAISAAISVRSGDSVIPISRRSPVASSSTVITVKNANSGMLRAVTTRRPGSMTAKRQDPRHYPGSSPARPSGAHATTLIVPALSRLLGALPPVGRECCVTGRIPS